MPLDKTKFAALCRTLSEIDLFGDGPPKPPWKKRPSARDVVLAVTAAGPRLPLVYQDSYVRPLRDNAAHLVQQPWAVETMAGAVYDHAASSGVDAALDRFLAVVSNLYRSFCNERRRAKADFPLVETLPPLATFASSGRSGPFTITVEDAKRLCGASVGVVSLPSTHREHPVLWASLAHETGGHDVLHADPGLLPELARGAYRLFGGAPIPTGGDLALDQFLGLLWSYWIDEAASDVYGVLNIGPSFGLNLAAFFSAMNAPRGKGRPSLRTDSGADEAGWLDPHPTDIVRLHLILGAVETLGALSASARRRHAADLRLLATLCGGGARKVRLQGALAISRDRAVQVDTSVGLPVLQEAARKVGAFIATSRLESLKGHGIQEIESWDDADEASAARIAQSLAARRPVAGMGDDAQLLAGATAALAQDPAAYARVTDSLADALTESFALDPIWGQPPVDHAYLRTRIVSDYRPNRGWIARVGAA